jgi:hypothetical protein
MIPGQKTSFAWPSFRVREAAANKKRHAHDMADY